MNAHLKVILSSILIVGLVSGCATGPDLGDSMAARGEAVTDIARDYKRGEALVKKGEKNIRNGRKLINKGEQQVRDGRRLQGVAERDFCAEVQYSDPACQ